MNKISPTLFVLVSLLLCLVTIQPVHSQYIQTIHIKPDGSINPSNAPLQRNGQTYTLTANTNEQIILETDNIILDGADHTLQGSGFGVALNMTCSNVTVENVHMVSWDAGVLGVFNNNTIRNSVITKCNSGFKIYAQYYIIISNDIEKNTEGIRIGPGGLNFIAGNKIADNNIGLNLFDSNNFIIQNEISNSLQTAINLEGQAYNETIFSNNFIGNPKIG